MGETLEEELARLPEDIRWRLQRGDGFLDLDMPERARRELTLIPASFRTATSYRRLDLRLAVASSEWAQAADLATGLRDQWPDDPEYWVQLAYAKRRQDGIEVARRVLLDAVPRFPRIAVIPFNMACYECQLGRHDEALKLLRRAFKLDPSYGELALDDEDLAPLWPMLG